PSIRSHRSSYSSTSSSSSGSRRSRRSFRTTRPGRGSGTRSSSLTALWWAWAGYAWLTNAIDPGDGIGLASVLAAMAAMFVAALAVPEAFGREGVVFGVSFLIVNAMQATLYALGARGSRDLLEAIHRVVPWVLGGSLLILAAGFTDDGLRPALWVI